MSTKVLLIFLFFSYFLIQSFLFFLFSQSRVSYFPIFLSNHATGHHDTAHWTELNWTTFIRVTSSKLATRSLETGETCVLTSILTPSNVTVSPLFLVFTHVTRRLTTVAIRHVGVPQTSSNRYSYGCLHRCWLLEEKWEEKQPRIFSYSIICQEPRRGEPSLWLCCSVNSPNFIKTNCFFLGLVIYKGDSIFPGKYMYLEGQEKVKVI